VSRLSCEGPASQSFSVGEEFGDGVGEGERMGEGGGDWGRKVIEVVVFMAALLCNFAV